MGKKLYVGNLSWGVTDSQLQELFSPYGTVVSAQVIMDRDTGRSKGFGFVEMGTDQEAQAAISGMHGQQIEGRPLTVNEARPKEGGGGGGGGGGTGCAGGGNRVFVTQQDGVINNLEAPDAESCAPGQLYWRER